MNPEEENRFLRQSLGILRAEAAENEAKLRKIQTLELQLLTTESLSKLLDRFVAGMLNVFALEAVSLVLHDPEHEIRHLLLNCGIRPEQISSVLLADDLLNVSPLYKRLHGPQLGPYLSGDHRMLFPMEKTIRSVAVLPLFRLDSLMGSLNFGSVDPLRYLRHYSTDFLAHLAAVGAVCLENMFNRERLLFIGLTDLVTGCHNRRYLERRLAEAVAEAQRYKQPLSCLFIDADHFKRINDTYGHAAGDQILQLIARRIKGELRASDVVARYGGEEFAVLLPQTAAEDAVRQAERIRKAIAADPLSLQNGQEIGVTVSIGVTEAPRASTLPWQMLGEQLLAEADAALALYRAKAVGRNCVVRGEVDVIC